MKGGQWLNHSRDCAEYLCTVHFLGGIEIRPLISGLVLSNSKSDYKYTTCLDPMSEGGQDSRLVRDKGAVPRAMREVWMPHARASDILVASLLCAAMQLNMRTALISTNKYWFQHGSTEFDIGTYRTDIMVVMKKTLNNHGWVWNDARLSIRSASSSCLR